MSTSSPPRRRRFHDGATCHSPAPASRTSCSVRTRGGCGSSAKTPARRLVVFVSREAALRFARLESADEHFAVVHVNDGVEFDYAA